MKYLLIISSLLIGVAISVAGILLSYESLRYANTGIILLLSIYVIILTTRVKKKVTSKDNTDEVKYYNQTEKLEKLRTELKSKEEQIAALNREITSLKERISQLELSLYRLDATIPILEKLKALVQEKTEKTIIEVTNDIFDIANKSSALGEKIGKFLSDIFLGERSIKKDIHKLGLASGEIESIKNSFLTNTKTLSANIKLFTDKIKKIESYIVNIIDLSEETNLLAVNTAIEAARMGHNAGGFPVIARGIQELSNRSKEIAKDITNMVNELGELINKLFIKLEEQSIQSSESLSSTSETLNKISDYLNSEINLAEQSIEETEKLPTLIREELDGIVNKLQFQDIMQQIINHIVDIVATVRESGGVVSFQYTTSTERERVKREVEELAGKKFTVKEEWEITGIEEHNPEETRQELFKGTPKLKEEKKLEEELKGDITLF